MNNKEEEMNTGETVESVGDVDNEEKKLIGHLPEMPLEAEEKIPGGMQLPEMNAEQTAAYEAKLVHVKAEKEKMWAFIFSKLTESKRFLEFVDNNYTIVQEMNEEAKSIEVKVIEKPLSIGPKLAPRQIARIQTAIATSGATSTGTTFKEIMEILGQESSGIIMADVSDINEQKT